jgi:CheY-like chemotaxis protein
VARILLVDDDIAEISAVKRVLTRGAHQTLLATNAQDALVFVARGAPSLILVSSECEGGEALRMLADDGGARALPLVVLGETPTGPAGAAQLARPIDPAQLADQVNASLSASQRPGAPKPEGPPPTGAVRGPGPRAAPRTDGASADAASARRAAADALRARAEELRRRPAAAGTRSAAPPPPAPDTREPVDEGLEAILRRAEEAERAHAAERSARERQKDRAVVEAAQRAEAERIAVEKSARARAAEERAGTERRARSEAERIASEKDERARAAEERAHAEERARTEAERIASEKAERARAAEERARAEVRARAEAERVASEKTERARAAEERARAEKRARAQAERRAREEAEARERAEHERREAEEQARRTVETEEAARDAVRRDAEEQLEQLRVQLDEERRTAEQRIVSVMKRAEAEEQASEELRRLAEENAQRRADEEGQRRAQAEEELRNAIASARAEMEALRQRTEEEARRRAEAETEMTRVAAEAERRAAEAQAEVTRVAAEAERKAAEAQAEVTRLAAEAERRAAEAAAQPAPFDLPVYRPPDEDPEPDPAEEAARRRVAALRERAAPPREPAPQKNPEPQPDPAAARPLRAPPPELRGGTVADLTLPRLLALAARHAVTGRMDFEGETARSIHFEDGRVVGATSADPAERVEELALRLGLVTRDQHRQIGAAVASLASRRAALLLLERGFLKPTELTPLVRRRTEEVLFGIFAETDARFRWAAEEVPADERIALERSTLELAVEGVRRRWRADRVDAVLGGAGTLVAPVATGPSPADLGLTPEERRAVALADGLRTVDEIASASPIDALSARQVLAALVLVGTLAVRTFQGGRPIAAAAAAIDLARVREKLDQVRRADYFTILGVGRLSTPYEIREAADRLLAEFDPVRYQGVREDGLPARLAEILRVVADAKDVLADDRLRDEYLHGLGD